MVGRLRRSLEVCGFGKCSHRNRAHREESDRLHGGLQSRLGVVSLYVEAEEGSAVLSERCDGARCNQGGWNRYAEVGGECGVLEEREDEKQWFSEAATVDRMSDERSWVSVAASHFLCAF